MPRKWTHKIPRKAHKLFFVANDVPTGAQIEQIMTEIFGSYTKSAAAMTSLMKEFRARRTLTLSDKQVGAVSEQLVTEKVSKGVFYAALKDLISLGVIRRDESGFYSLITDFSSALKRMAESYKDFVNRLKTGTDITEQIETKRDNETDVT